jgi:hypothetical protein
MLVAAMVLVTLAVGFCLFDGDEHGTADDGASLDLCFGLALASIAVLMLELVPVHTLSVDPPYLARAVPRRRLDPPPKSSTLY